MASVRCREEGKGYAASLLLHVMALLLVLWHLPHRVPRSPPPTMVELIAPSAPGRSGEAVASFAARPHRASRPAGAALPAMAPLQDPVEARIEGLARLSKSDTALPAPDNGGDGGGNGPGGYALADYVRAQILRRWWPTLTTDAARGTKVALRLKINRAGVLSDIRIVDQARFASDQVFRDMALSARNAAINASPIALPAGSYPASTEISITLDPRAVLR